MPQKPKNSEIRLTEPANLDEGGYIAGKMTPEEYEEAVRKFKLRAEDLTGQAQAAIDGLNLSPETLKAMRGQ